MHGLLSELVADGTRLRVRIDVVSALQRLVRGGELDFYISGLPVDSEEQAISSPFRIRRIPFSRLGLLVRRGHPLLDGPLTKERLALYPTACGTFLREILSPMRIAYLGLQPPSVEIDDYNMLAALAWKTDFAIIGTSVLARSRPDLALVALPFEIPMDDVEWGLVSSSRTMLSPTAAKVATRIFGSLAESVAAAVQPARGGKD